VKIEESAEVRAGAPMGLSVRMAPVGLRIDAGRDLVFRRITDFGAPSGDGPPSNVLSSDGNSLLVEFLTPVLVLPGIRRTYRTVERVTLHEAESVEFEEVEGPFSVRKESISLRDDAGGTHVEYTARLVLRGWIFGWLLGALVVRRLLRRAVLGHLREIKSSVEAG
jgi:hypothetical protein